MSIYLPMLLMQAWSACAQGCSNSNGHVWQDSLYQFSTFKLVLARELRMTVARQLISHQLILHICEIL